MSDSYLNCEKCGKAAVQRELIIKGAKECRRVVFRTHFLDEDSPDYLATIQRISDFHEKAWQLLDELRLKLNLLSPLTFGRYTEIDIQTLKPPACDPRRDVIINAIVRVGGIEGIVKLPPQPVDSVAVSVALHDLRLVAEPIIQEIKSRLTKLDY